MLVAERTERTGEEERDGEVTGSIPQSLDKQEPRSFYVPDKARHRNKDTDVPLKGLP